MMNKPLFFLRITILIIFIVNLPACILPTRKPEPAPVITPVVERVSPEQRLAIIYEIGKAADNELQMEPIREPQVEYLRQQSMLARSNREYAYAADLLNQALLLVDNDPAILQERAEVALLQSEYDRAQVLAQRAWESGSQTGPLCRRHWATIEQAQQAQNKIADAELAHEQIASCTVAGFERM